MRVQKKGIKADRKEGREGKTRGDEKRQGTVSIRC
jgi:hypothetical protein